MAKAKEILATVRGAGPDELAALPASRAATRSTTLVDYTISRHG